MQVALIHKHFDEDHLREVKAKMEVLGAPTIKAVWMECWGIWAALEGCHRLRAAHALGLAPKIEEVEYSDDLQSSAGINDGDDAYTIAEIADAACSAKILTFEDAE